MPDRKTKLVRSLTQHFLLWLAFWCTASAQILPDERRGHVREISALEGIYEPTRTITYVQVCKNHGISRFDSGEISSDHMACDKNGLSVIGDLEVRQCEIIKMPRCIDEDIASLDHGTRWCAEFFGATMFFNMLNFEANRFKIDFDLLGNSTMLGDGHNYGERNVTHGK